MSFAQTRPAVASCIYFYSLIYLLGDSTSWNVYACF